MSKLPDSAKLGSDQTPDKEKGAQQVLLGVIVAPHGVKGLVKLKSFTEEPEALASYGPLSDKDGKRFFTLTLKGRLKGLVLAALSGIDSLEAAQALKGLALYCPAERLPKSDDDEVFYHHELIGLVVEDESAQVLGTVKALYDFGAGPVVEILARDGKSFVWPFLSRIFKTIDLKAGKVIVAPPQEL